jgi:Mor family transcriptional regulator
MSYKNAKELLPPQLLEELQEYFSGGIIYVPKTKRKAGWGELSGTRRALDNRNAAIRMHFQSGMNIEELSDKYFLSEETIRKIVYTKKIALAKTV